MSIGHIFGEIGKGVLKVAPFIGQALGGPFGLLISTGANIATAELEHGPSTGPVKQAQVLAQTVVSPTLAASPVAPDARVEAIKSLINNIVAVLNSLSLLFPAPPTQPTIQGGSSGT